MELHRRLVIWYAIVLHWIWGCMLLSSSAPLNVTAIYSLTKFGLVSQASTAVLYFTVSLFAMLGTFAPYPANILFLLPQQVVLFVSAYGAIIAMIAGQFADGVARPTSFLVADQSPAVIIAVFYFITLVATHVRAQRAGPSYG